MQTLEFETLEDAEAHLTMRGLAYTGQDGMLGSYYASHDNTRKAHLVGADSIGWEMNYWVIQ
mgnify:CR=1 FL=1